MSDRRSERHGAVFRLATERATPRSTARAPRDAAAARRDQDDVNQLHQILKRHLDDLSQAQREILVESFYKEGKRADIAARRGITASTYDNHRQAAFKALRDSLAADVNESTGVDRSIWYDRIEELIKRRAAREQGRSASTKGKRSSSEGKSGTFEGKGRNPRGKRRNSRGERRNVEGEHRPLKGERSNSAHERGHNVSAGAADEPFAGTSPAARSEPERAGRSS